MESKLYSILFGILLFVCCALFFIDPNEVKNLIANYQESSPAVTTTDEILLYNSEKSFNGYNLYSSIKRRKALLINMQGELAHSWSGPAEENAGWYHIEPAADGNLFALTQDRDIVKLDTNSNVIWSLQGRYHHDLDVAENGNIFVLSREDRWIAFKDSKARILDDKIVEISPDGKVIEIYSLYDLVREFVPEKELEQALRYTQTKNPVRLAPDTRADILHTNSLEILKRDIPGVARKGSILVCFRTFHSIAFLNLEQKKVEWIWGPGRLDHPHHPSILDNDNILVFDNGRDRLYSQVIEVNPKLNKVVWEHGESKGKGRYFSNARGSAERLPNGNTLVTVADKGKVFEVTSGGEKTWIFANSETEEITSRRGTKERRAPIYRMRRIAKNSKLLPVAVREGVLGTS